MTTIFFYVLLFQIKDWDKICEEEGKMTAYSGGYPFSISGDIRSVPS